MSRDWCHFSLWRRSRRRTEHPVRLTTAAQEHDGSLFVALELSKSIWLIAVSTPVSKYRVAVRRWHHPSRFAGSIEVAGELYCGRPVQIVSIYEARLDGFWVHRLLEPNGVESHVVHALSIVVDRRSRQAKKWIPPILSRYPRDGDGGTSPRVPHRM